MITRIDPNGDFSIKAPGIFYPTNPFLNKELGFTRRIIRNDLQKM